MPPENDNNNQERRTFFSDVSNVAGAAEDVSTAVGETAYSAGKGVGGYTGEKIRQSVAGLNDAGVATQSYFTPRGSALPVSGTYEGGAPDTNQSFSVDNTGETQNQQSTSSQPQTTTTQQTSQTPQQETQQRAMTPQDIQGMTSPANQVFPDMTNPADQVVTEPNVEQTIDGGATSEATSQTTPPEAQRQNDFQETLSNVEQRARQIQQQLNNRDEVDFSAQSRPVVETDEQRQMVEQSDDPDTLRQRMDEVREQFNMPELEKRRRQIANQVEAEREAFNRTIQEVDNQDQIFGAMERRRLENLETQRDQRIQALSNLENTITQQIDSINTRVNQEVQAEQVRDQREQEQAQQQRQRVGNLIETGALANMSDQEITSIAQESGYTPQTLARVRQAQQQSLQQVDASGEAGEFQDLKQLGAIGEDVTYQQFLQMQEGNGGGAAQFQREFSSALQLAQNQVANMTRQQLINTINQRTSELSGGEIEDIVTQAEQQAGPNLQAQRFAQTVQREAQSQRALGVTDPDDAAERVMQEYASSQGLDDTGDIPDNIRNIIKNITSQTYGNEQ